MPVDTAADPDADFLIDLEAMEAPGSPQPHDLALTALDSSNGLIPIDI